MIQPLQMIKPIGKPQPPIVFKSKEGEEVGKDVVRRDTLETIEYADGTRALVKSNYEGDMLKDRTVSVFSDKDTKIRTFIQILNKKETGNKLDKMA